MIQTDHAFRRVYKNGMMRNVHIEDCPACGGKNADFVLTDEMVLCLIRDMATYAEIQEHFRHGPEPYMGKVMAKLASVLEALDESGEVLVKVVKGK